MLTILSGAFQTATRFGTSDQATRYHNNRRPLKTWEVERLDAERRRRAMKYSGML